MAVARKVLKNRVYLSMVFSRSFLGIGSIVCPKFWHDVRNSYEVEVSVGSFEKKKKKKKKNSPPPPKKNWGK